MNTEQELYEALDKYSKGLLTADEVISLQAMIESDAVLKTKAEKHRAFTSALQHYGKRKALKNTLDQIHRELEQDTLTPSSSEKYSWKKYAMLSGIAASIALISVLATVFISQSFEKKQTADYKVLRRTVEQIKKSQNQIVADLTKSKKKIFADSKYSGTGFLISPNGYLATSYHVIKEADSVFIENEVFGQLKTTVIYTDPLNDLALLEITDNNFKIKNPLPFSIQKASADMGESVYTLGYPREDVVFGEGSVSASTGYKENPNAYQISIPVNPGNSGGPLLNANGDVIGIISGLQTATVGAAFAIKSSLLLDALHHQSLDTLQRPLSIGSMHALKKLNRPAQINQWRKFVFEVKVYNEK